MSTSAPQGAHSSSHKSNKSKKSRSSHVKSTKSATSSVLREKLELEKTEAALQVQLAFAEKEKELRLLELEEAKKIEAMKIEREQKLEQLQLEKQLAETRAVRQVIEESEDSSSLASELTEVTGITANKSEHMQKFLNSQQGEHFPPPCTPVPQDVSASVDNVPPCLVSSAEQDRCDEQVSAPEFHHQSGGEWMAMSSVLEKCISQLTESSRQQHDVNQRLVASSQLPKIVVPLFSGDPLQYPLWRNSFNSLIDSQPLDADTKLNYLNQYVTGRPKQLVEHYMLIGTEEAYIQARCVLNERYGNSNVVSTAFTSKLRQWPKLTPRDAVGLRDFSDFLGKVNAARATTPSLGVLDYASENAHLVEKLPFNLETKWRDKIDFWRQIHGQSSYPPFTEFVKFVKVAADRANIPELQSISRGQDKRSSSSNVPMKHARGQSTSAFSTTTSQSDKTRAPSKSEGTTKGKQVSGDENSCLFCKKHHLLDECERFLRKPFQERKDFFFKRRLCMGCARACNHQVRECSDKKVCQICGGAHLTCLHRNSPKKQPEETPSNHPELATAGKQAADKVTTATPPKEIVTVHGLSNCIQVCSQPDQEGEGDQSMIIPVLIRNQKDPSKEFLEYAILDEQSNSCFISRALCEKMNLQGPQTELLLSTMQEQNVRISSSRIAGLEVLDVGREHTVQLPVCFERESIPAKKSQIPKPAVVHQWPHLRCLADKLMPYDPSLEISLLIGSNCPRVVRPREILAGGEDDPYGQRSLLGWGVIGNTCKDAQPMDDQPAVCNKVIAAYPQSNLHFVYGTKVKELLHPENVLKVLASDFVETHQKKPYSVEDEKFLNLMETGIKKRSDGHYQMPLPLKSDAATLPNNRQLAVKRWNQLSARFRRNERFRDDYREFMADVIANWAERVSHDQLDAEDGRVNYVPHTGVYHPKKPDKIRVVFDCSAKFGGVSLNDHLLQGPDMTNGLLGVLCRFRKEEVAFMVDVKSMFHQFYVEEKFRDLLRFLWWENGDPERPVVEYRMKVHLFGAASSPGCANFGLKRAADDGEDEFGTEAANFIRDDFYVDDGLKSLPTVDKAASLIKASQNLCAKAGLKLHKIVSNKRELLEKFPAESRASGTKELDLKVDALPMERALGVTWCVESDTFQFHMELKDRPFTRRGILSTVSSIYDPNGYVAPVTLRGKRILQQMCRDKLDWDSPVPELLRPQWEKWRLEVLSLEKIQIQRCFKPKDFGVVSAVELHHFSDASQDGYGQCSYLRLINKNKRAHCSFVVGKARVAPLKLTTIPRLELAAATVSANVSEFLRRELCYEMLDEYYWTDSKIVLGYINNEARRFHVYVANRVQQIRSLTDPERWMYVDTKENPADEASRGLTAQELSEKSCWLSGPDFLQRDGSFQPQPVVVAPLSESDPDVKRVSSFATSAKDNAGHSLEVGRLDHFPSWNQACRGIAMCLKLKTTLRFRAAKKPGDERACLTSAKQEFTVAELQDSEKEIIKIVQREHFSTEIKTLQDIGEHVVGQVTDRKVTRLRNDSLKKTSCLFRLDPFLDVDGIIKVGGRIARSDLPNEVKHPVILPRKGHVTELLIRHFHEKVNHMGRGMTHNELRQRGYWVIGGSSAVSNYIAKCVTCRRLRGTLQHQKMADLPEDRLLPSPPFSFCAVDYFGPFLIKERRSEVKRYGVLFTCMSSRGVHLETANSLSTNAFINALSRFLSRRGPVRQLRCDQGTNFVGAQNELREALREMSQEEVQKYLLQNGCDWIPFKMNTPHSSHMGGAWERQIKTVRSALAPLLRQAGGQLDDEAFRTFMTEVECIVNSRPLTSSNLSSPDVPEPLTPNHLLTMKSKVVLPPPGKFQRADLYSVKWWRRVQYLANQFWQRWRKEFLLQLQTRQKWERPQPNLGVGDVVIVKENESETRGQWPLARVIETFPSADGRVRKVRLKMADAALDKRGRRKHPPTLLDRPVHKIVLLLAASAEPSAVTAEDQSKETRGFPNKEPAPDKKSNPYK